MLSAAPVQATALSEDQLRRLSTRRIFFGHQSVGANILDGIRDLLSSDPRLKLRIVRSENPELDLNAGFFECPIGRNRDPESKNAAFAAIMHRGMGAQGGIALFKYCYIDFNSSTDVGKVFRRYRELIAELRNRYSSLMLVHVTVPLTAEEDIGTTKERIRSALKRLSGRDANVKRNAFNELLRKTYMGKEPIFDLATLESTRPDGSRTFFRRGKTKVYTLAREFTRDGGHLNDEASRMAGEQLLLLLSGL